MPVIWVMIGLFETFPVDGWSRHRITDAGNAWFMQALAGRARMPGGYGRGYEAKTVCAFVMRRAAVPPLAAAIHMGGSCSTRRQVFSSPLPSFPRQRDKIKISLGRRNCLTCSRTRISIHIPRNITIPGSTDLLTMGHEKREGISVRTSESGAIVEDSNATEATMGTSDEKPSNTKEEDSPPYSSFTRWQKAWMTFLVAFAGMFSPMSSFIYYPAINSLAEGLGTTVQNINLTITSYMVVSGVVPAIMGNLADTLGRRPIYILAFVIYLAANIGLAVQRSFPALLVLRMIQSAGSSGEFCST